MNRCFLRVLIAVVAFGNFGLSLSTQVEANDVGDLVPSPLLAIDQNRATVIDRIVGDWGVALERANAGISATQLREMLTGLRADHLLAASLAGSVSGLRDVLANALSASANGTTAPARAERVAAKAIGDANQDLTYTPVSPCRLFDTRPSQGGIGVLMPSVRRTYGATVPVANQGGPGGCAAGAGAAVALIQLGTVSPTGSGVLQGGPQGVASFPNALILYQAGDQYGTAVAMPLNAANGQFDVQVLFAATDAYADLLGFFKAPAGGAVTMVGTGTGLTGGPITSTGTISVAAGGIGTTELAANAVTTAKVADAAITSTKVADLAITSTKVADAAITSPKLAAGVVTAGLPSCQDGQVLRRVTGAWTCATLAPSISLIDTIVPNNTSIVLGADGLPVIAYYDSASADLKVAKCLNANCSGTTITTVDSAGSVGQSASIALGADANPVISYWDQTNGKLKVAKCANPACTGAATITSMADPLPNVGAYSSIAVGPDTFPVISYYDGNNQDLRIAKCSNPFCVSTTTFTTIDSVGNVGRFTSIAVGADNLPFISYYDTTNIHNKVAKCLTANCSTGATLTTVDTSTFGGVYNSVAVPADGLPIVSYDDGNLQHLKVAKCINAACTGSATITTVDSTQGTGPFNSITVGPDNLPVISYLDSIAGDLKVAKCANAACTGTATISTVDSIGTVGYTTAIAVGSDGFPSIAYGDATNVRLKFVKCTTPACVGP